MTRKPVVLALGLLIVTGGLGTAVAGLLLHEPDAYLRRAVPPGQDRKKKSGEFQSEFTRLMLEFHGGEDSKQGWNAHFKEEDINSFFEESFVSSGMAERFLPEGISQPRIAIDPDRIRLMFRYRLGPWNTVVSVDLSVWLAAKETNVVALELQGLHAGLLPVSAQSLLERISEAPLPDHIEVTWYRHNRNPVALLRFQADQRHPTIQLQKLVLTQGCLDLTCLSSDPATLGAMLPWATLKPVSN